ncbi:MAG TPA: hypothetical protein VFE76_17555, partial [Myxococcales bacterium]|nr:hypothetical protein [Myxococcales bacterium]
MDALQVMDRAQRGQIRQVIASASRPVPDVVRAIRGPAATGYLAKEPIALEHLPVERVPHPEERLPDVDEVLRDCREALARRDPSARGLSRCGAGQGDHRRHAAGRPDLDLAPCAHLRFLASVELASQRDARDVLAALDPSIDPVILRVSRDEARFLVGDPPVAHRLAQLGNLVEPVFQRRSLLDRTRSHPDPLVAIVCEG